MRRLVPYVAFGLTLFAIGLLILIPLLSCEPTHPSAPARFVQEELCRSIPCSIRSQKPQEKPQTRQRRPRRKANADETAI